MYARILRYTSSGLSHSASGLALVGFAGFVDVLHLRGGNSAVFIGKLGFLCENSCFSPCFFFLVFFANFPSLGDWCVTAQCAGAFGAGIFLRKSRSFFAF